MRGLSFSVDFTDLNGKSADAKELNDNSFGNPVAAPVSGLWDFLLTHLHFAKERENGYL